MELQLKNIGIIKEANVKIDGLTVIAGENDTGKSTVGKALYTLLRAKTLSSNKDNEFFKKKFESIAQKIFKNQIIQNNSFVSIEKNIIDYENSVFEFNKDNFLSAILIESPLIWNLYEFFNSAAQMAAFSDTPIKYPYINWDLFTKLANERNEEYALAKELVEKINGIIDGDFIQKKENFQNKYVFVREKEEFEIDNIAMGIKSFGTILVLIKNNYVTKRRILIFDEPEVHLHPKWQLEMAKVLVELVKNGVKIVVNSHSPYMIEALKRYAEVENAEDKTNFYLAEGGYIKQIKNSNSKTLEKIFEKLSEPFEIFEKMDSESLEKLING